jgi:hypothetical protein
MAVTKLTPKGNSGASKSGAAVKVGAKASADTAKQVTAHPGLVKLLKGIEEAKQRATSYLIDAATLVQKEQLSKEEVIASIMEARDCDRKYAGEQYSRLRQYLNKPEILEDLREGRITLKEAKVKVKGDKGSRTRKPSPKEIQQNAAKTITTSITRMLNAAKNAGIDLQSLLSTVKEAAKKAGIK